MLAGKLFRNKSYFTRMVLWISAAILAIVIVLAAVVYMKAQTVLVKKQSETDQSMLYQIRYNIELVNQTIANMSKALYVDQDVSAVMYAKSENMEDMATRLNKIYASITAANPFIHSVSIYNSSLRQYYSTGAPQFYQDGILEGLVRSGISVPILKPVFRDIGKMVNERTEPENVFSYFVYDASAANTLPEGVIVVNVRPQWLLENIRQINGIHPDRQSDSLFVLDRFGKLLDDGADRSTHANWLLLQWEQFQRDYPRAESEGSFQGKQGNTRYIVHYSIVESSGMTLLKSQPLDEVYQSINSLKTGIMLITGIFLVMAIMLSVMVSRKIYRPFGVLFHSIKEDGSKASDRAIVFDEISYLDSVYRAARDKLDHYDQQKYQHKDIVKHYWLNRLLTERSAFPEDEMESIFCEMRIALPLQGSYAVILMKLDHYSEFQHKYSSLDKDTIRFGILNIASEIVAVAYPNEGLDLKGDHVVLIIGISEGNDFDPSRLDPLIREAQYHVERFFKVTFTASISDSAAALELLHASYNQSLNVAMHRFFTSHSAVLTTDIMNLHNRNSTTVYSKSTEDSLLAALKSRSMDALEETLAAVFAEIAAFSYRNAFLAVIRLLDTLKETLETMKVSIPAPLLLDFSATERNVFEKETLADIHQTVWHALQDALRESADKSAEQHRNGFLVHAVTEYIGGQYQDPNLCLTSIAETMNLSTRRLSKLFKEVSGISIPEYINEVRLTRAAELLAGSSLSVHEVVQQVGILNESYFFILFKKKYGSTPKEYALHSNVNQLTSTL